MNHHISNLAANSLGLLGSTDPAPLQIVNQHGRASLILVCDHASNAIPQCRHNLGLSPEQLNQHIAWDIGAASVTRKMAIRLNAPAVLAGYSRLLIDCNRPPGNPQSIVRESDGIIIPGNQEINDLEAELRLETFFWPYHHAITNILAQLWRHGCGRAPALVAIHSFTPRLRQESPRPWHLGVLWNRDPRLASSLLQQLRSDPELCVGDNEPYSGRNLGFTMDRHAGVAGLPHVEIEIRQDLISDEKGCQYWADRLVETLKIILKDPINCMVMPATDPINDVAIPPL